MFQGVLRLQSGGPTLIYSRKNFKTSSLNLRPEEWRSCSQRGGGAETLAALFPRWGDSCVQMFMLSTMEIVLSICTLFNKFTVLGKYLLSCSEHSGTVVLFQDSIIPKKWDSLNLNFFFYFKDSK